MLHNSYSSRYRKTWGQEGEAYSQRTRPDSLGGLPGPRLVCEMKKQGGHGMDATHDTAAGRTRSQGWASRPPSAQLLHTDPVAAPAAPCRAKTHSRRWRGWDDRVGFAPRTPLRQTRLWSRPPGTGTSRVRLLVRRSALDLRSRHPKSQDACAQSPRRYWPRL